MSTRPPAEGRHFRLPTSPRAAVGSTPARGDKDESHRNVVENGAGGGEEIGDRESCRPPRSDVLGQSAAVV
eukprot:701840-Prorocentrum_minimum.AAC.4